MRNSGNSLWHRLTALLACAAIVVSFASVIASCGEDDFVVGGDNPPRPPATSTPEPTPDEDEDEF